MLEQISFLFQINVSLKLFFLDILTSLKKLFKISYAYYKYACTQNFDTDTNGALGGQSK